MDTFLASQRLAEFEQKIATTLMAIYRAEHHDFISLLKSAEFSLSEIRNKNWSGIDFSNDDIRGIDFSYCNLVDTNFDGADIEGCLFIGAQYSETCFAKSKNTHRAVFFPPNIGAALENAKLAVSTTVQASRDGDWGLVEAMLARLDVLRRMFPDSAEIALCEAQAALAVSDGAYATGNSACWPKMEMMLARLTILVEDFSDTGGIALCHGQAWYVAYQWSLGIRRQHGEN
jgi:hypothetical protein